MNEFPTPPHDLRTHDAAGMAISALRGTRPPEIPPYELRETRRGRRR